MSRTTTLKGPKVSLKLIAVLDIFRFDTTGKFVSDHCTHNHLGNMLQVYGYYNSSNDTFYCSSAYLVVPKFGRIPMISDVAFKLNHSDAVEVNLGKAANGTIKIEYYGANKELVAFNYNLNIAFVGKGQDTIGLFPVSVNSSSQLKLYIAHLSCLGNQLPPRR